MKNKLFYLFICLLIFLFFPVSSVKAIGEFQADYDVSYSVTPSGSTIVTEMVTLTNKETNLYPKQYSVVIDTTGVSDVIARDDGGVIIPDVKQSDGKTSIFLTFNQKVVGLGKQLTFTLRFQNQEIAIHNGNIWEVNIPGVASDPDLGSYNVTLDTPPAFGPNSYMSPLPANGRRWNKEQMLKGGISAAYGNKQIYNLDLSYFLENPKVTPVKTEIALPPDTAFQKIEIKSLDPKPETVVRDADGNWLARYILLPGAQTRVSLKAIAEIYLTPRLNFKEKLADPAPYVSTSPYWEADNPKIKTLANQYKTARAIYDYVVTALTYDENLVGQNPLRKGALAALATPTHALCTEFTDLFIAIARAAGIPAREAVGYAYTTNSKLRPLSLVFDVLHAWPEYYDSARSLWIPIDPTWGNTTKGVDYFNKLDFDHVVFAIQGLNSNYPYPAGFYRQNGESGKDVNVVFGSDNISDKPVKLQVNFNFPDRVTAGFKTTGNVELFNPSGLSVDAAVVDIEAAPFPYSLQKDEINIPPFAKIDYPLTISVESYFTKGRGQINATVNGQTDNFFFTVEPLYWLLVPLGILAAGIPLLIWIFLVKLRLWKRKKPI